MLQASRNLAGTVTAVGIQFGELLGGTVLTELVFAWPGLGQVMLTGINARDYPTVQGAVILLALVFVAVNLAVDLAYAVLDPRVRYA